MRFGLIFFDSSDPGAGHEPYDLVLDCARFADRAGFSRLWLPERHHTREGHLFPNPAVVQAALARETRDIRLCAGSVVAPLHDPLRIAQEWSVVDNLSGGRVELSFASGWHPSDFVLFPERYNRRREITVDTVRQVRALWRGEKLTREDGNGNPVDVGLMLQPRQAALPVWLTAAGNPDTFRSAAEQGAGVLTHLFNQEVDELGERIALYRQHLGQYGADSGACKVAVMIHAHLGADGAEARAQATAAMEAYLTRATSLLGAIASSRGQDRPVHAMSERDKKDYAAYWLDRLVSTGRVLFGAPEELVETVRRLEWIGVDELALQVDFGLPADVILEGLKHAAVLQELVSEPGDDARTRSHAAQEDDSLTGCLARCTQEIDLAAVSARMASAGLEMGTANRRLEKLWRGNGEAIGTVSGRSASSGDEASREAEVIDASFAAVAAALWDRDAGESLHTLVPVRVARVSIEETLPDRLYAHVRVAERPQQDTPLVADVRLFAADGAILGRIDGIGMRRTAGAPIADANRSAALSAYEMALRPAPLRNAAAGQDGPWLILGDGRGLGPVLAAHCAQHGIAHSLVLADQSPDTLEAALTLQPGPLRGIVNLLPLDHCLGDAFTGEDAMRVQAALLDAVLPALRGCARRRDRIDAGMLFVTRGAQDADASDKGIRHGVAQSTVWGMLSAAEHEAVPFACRLVDLEPGSTVDECAAQIVDELTASDGEPRVCYRSGQRHAPRLLRLSAPVHAPVRIDPDASYLITGGLGTLGLSLARRLVAEGARRIVLVSRTPLADAEAETQAAIRDLGADGAEVRHFAADVSDEAAMRDCACALARDGWLPLGGLAHLAGSAEIQRLLETDAAALLAVMRPKLAGAVVLDRVFGTHVRDFFVLYSSWAHFMPPIGQSLAGYRAANAFLDAFAASLRARGVPALAIDWGDWSAPSRMRRRLLPESQGYPSRKWRFSERRGLDALSAWAGASRARVALLQVTWSQWLSEFGSEARNPLLSELLQTEGAPARSTARADPVETGRPVGAATDVVAQIVADVLRIEPGQLSAGSRLVELGLDSLLAFELRKRIELRMGALLPVATLIRCGTIAAIADAIEGEAPGMENPVAPEPAGHVARASPIDQMVESEVDAALDRILKSRNR